MTGPNYAQRYRDAVWEASPDELTTAEAAVLHAYVDHVNGKHGPDGAWIARRRLMRRTKIRSVQTVERVIASVVAKGWLADAGKLAVRGGYTTLYRITLPSGLTIGPLRDQQDEPKRSAHQTASESESGLMVERKRSDHHHESGLLIRPDSEVLDSEVLDSEVQRARPNRYPHPSTYPQPPDRFTEDEPEQRCRDHQWTANPGPCGPCLGARQLHERWLREREKATAARIEWLRTCARCPNPDHAGEYAYCCRWCLQAERKAA